MIDPCWTILGIQPTESTRDVRKAYAHKLRETRPEDDPTAFQALHEAYQQALWLVKSVDVHQALPSESTPPPIEMSPRVGSFANSIFAAGEFEYQIDTPAVHSSSELTDEQEALQDRIEYQIDTPAVHLSCELTDEQEALQDRIMRQLGEMLSLPTTLDRLIYWDFITSTPDLLDEGFRVSLGRKVLRAIVEHHDASGTRRRQAPKLSPLVLGKLDSVFFWSSEPYQFVDHDIAVGASELFATIDELPTDISRPVGGEFIVGSPRDGKSRKSFKNPDVHPYGCLVYFVIFFLVQIWLRWH